jgi:hypothetical protein
MSNVIPFKSRPRNLIVTVDCSTPLEEGDLIAMQLSNGRVLLLRWLGLQDVIAKAASSRKALRRNAMQRTS